MEEEKNIFGINYLAATLALLLIISLVIVLYLYNRNKELINSNSLPQTSVEDKEKYVNENIDPFMETKANISETNNTNDGTKSRTKQTVINPNTLPKGSDTGSQVNVQKETSNLQTTTLQDKENYLNSFDTSVLPSTSQEEKENLIGR